jgi:hypothetical protein
VERFLGGDRREPGEKTVTPARNKATIADGPVLAAPQNDIEMQFFEANYLAIIQNYLLLQSESFRVGPISENQWFSAFRMKYFIR